MRRHARRRLPALAALLGASILVLLASTPAESRLVHESFPSFIPDVFLGSRRPVKETPRLSNDLEPFLPLHRRFQHPSVTRRKPAHPQDPSLQLSSADTKPHAKAPSPISSHFSVTERLASGGQLASDGSLFFLTGSQRAPSGSGAGSGVSPGTSRPSAQQEPLAVQAVPRDFIHPEFGEPAGKMSYEFQVQMANKELAPAPALALGPILSVPPAPAPANETYVIEVDATKEEVFASQGILLQIFMLATAFIVGHILRRRRFYYLHEASAALLIGEGSNWESAA